MHPGLPRYTPGFMREYIPAGRTFSERMDDEWYRLIMCHSITSSPRGLSGGRFTPSTLIGSWRGSILVRLSILHYCFKARNTYFGSPEQNHFQIPHLVEFRNFLNSNQPQAAMNTPVIFLPVEFELREHHCLGDEIYLMSPIGPDQVSDDPLNAWIPRDATFQEQNVSASFSQDPFCLQNA